MEFSYWSYWTAPSILRNFILLLLTNTQYFLSGLDTTGYLRIQVNTTSSIPSLYPYLYCTGKTLVKLACYGWMVVACSFAVQRYLTKSKTSVTRDPWMSREILKCVLPSTNAYSTFLLSVQSTLPTSRSAFKISTPMSRPARWWLSSHARIPSELSRNLLETSSRNQTNIPR